MLRSFSYPLSREKPQFFFRKEATAASPQYVLFDSVGQLSAAPLGPDMVDGSSWGVPAGTNPTNLINQLLNEMPGNNPFFLRKIVVRVYFVDPVTYPVNPLIGAPIVSNYEVKANGETIIDYRPFLNTYSQQDQEGITHEYTINRMYDGNSALVLQFSNQIRFDVSFYIEYQHLDYE